MKERKEEVILRKNDKFDIVGGKREVQKMLFCEKPPFQMAPKYKFCKKKSVFDPQMVICNKLLFFLQMENWLLIIGHLMMIVANQFKQ